VEFEIGDGEQALVNVPGKNNIDLIKSCLTYSSDNHIFQLDQLGMGLAIGPLMNLLVWFMVFNATFNIISVMSWEFQPGFCVTTIHEDVVIIKKHIKLIKLWKLFSLYCVTT
jgi:hypothetical protein